MDQHTNKIAILSPSKSAYSETFIQLQKKNIKGKIFYYYGGLIPTCLENQGKITNRWSYLYFNLIRVLGLTKFTVSELAIRKSFRENKIDIVLAHYGPTAHKILRMCKYLKIPLIAHFHGYDASVYSVLKTHNNYKELFKYAQKVVVVSKLMESKLIDLGCPRYKLIYNPCVAHTSFFDLNPDYTSQQFISVGRFTDKKAPYYTILAFKQIAKKFPEAKLLLAGDGELIQVCKNLVNFYHLNDQVEFLGIITPEQLKSYIAKSIAYVQHSITAINGDMEGTPVAIMEASAAGLPVISTRHAGIVDVIIDGKTGLLSDEHDVGTMIKNMEIVLNDKFFAAELGRAGRIRIKKNFNLNIHMNRLEEALYNK